MRGIRSVVLFVLASISVFFVRGQVFHLLSSVVPH
jgi:hypothetical protein